MLLNPLQCTGPPPTTENDLAPDVNYRDSEGNPALVYWPAECISDLLILMKKGAEFVLSNHLITQGWAALPLGRWLEVCSEQLQETPKCGVHTKGEGEKKPFCKKGNKRPRSHLLTVYKEPGLGFVSPG